MKCYFIYFSYSPFLKLKKKKSTQIIRPQKGNPEGSFEDTLLNFGLMYRNNIQYRKPEAELKEFKPRFKFKPRLKYCWFHLNLY